MHCQREGERKTERTLNAKIMNLNVRRDKSLRKRVKGRAHLLAKCNFHNLQDNLLYSIVYIVYIYIYNIYIHFLTSSSACSSHFWGFSTKSRNCSRLKSL